MSSKHDHLITHSHDELTQAPVTHSAPTKRSARIIATLLLIALALLILTALATGFSYWISPRGEYSGPL